MRPVLLMLLLVLAGGVSAQDLATSMIQESLGTGRVTPAGDTEIGAIAPRETHLELYRTAEAWLLAGSDQVVYPALRTVLEPPPDGVRLRLGLPKQTGSLIQVPVRLFLFDRTSRVYQLLLRSDDAAAYSWRIFDWYAREETVPE